jgi:hypothetical protein
MARSLVRVLNATRREPTGLPVYRADLTYPVSNAEHGKAAVLGHAVVAGPTVRQAKQAQHWDDRKSQSRGVTRRICPRRSGRTWQERMWNRLNREEQMTSNACRLVRPGAAAQGSPAHNGYVSVLPSGPLARGSSSSGGALVRLEPCEGKLSCTVLRGARARNRPRLPDKYMRARKKQIPGRQGEVWLLRG